MEVHSSYLPCRWRRKKNEWRDHFNCRRRTADCARAHNDFVSQRLSYLAGINGYAGALDYQFALPASDFAGFGSAGYGRLGAAALAEEENQKVEALDLGADDYITKPFGTSELLARIRTALRHQAKLESGDDMPRGSYSVRDLTVDFERRKVTLRGEEVHLTQIEYKIVELIARRPGRVLTYDYIISRIWGPYAVDNNRILRVNMAHIRRKLEDNPAEPYYIRTEIGVGYRMAEE